MRRSLAARTLQSLAGVEISGEPDACPLCNTGIQPVAQELETLDRHANVVERVFRCPRESCQRLFLAYYRIAPNSSTYYYHSSLPIELKDRIFSEELKKISPDYCSICNEAHKVELLGYLQVCGPGYRKALEFLIKDFVSQGKTPEQRADIQAIQLAPCIKKYVNDTRLKATAERAAWLGNDETHYVRKWEDKDLQDLKKFIKLTEYWIESEHLTQESVAQMPAGKK